MSDVDKRYQASLHAMQTGVLMELQMELPGLHEKLERFLKHERVGINSALCDQAAMMKLLMAKGLFTEAEYSAAIADEMALEVKRYEDRLTQLFGKTIQLG